MSIANRKIKKNNSFFLYSALPDEGVNGKSMLRPLEMEVHTASYCFVLLYCVLVLCFCLAICVIYNNCFKYGPLDAAQDYVHAYTLTQAQCIFPFNCCNDLPQNILF